MILFHCKSWFDRSIANKRMCRYGSVLVLFFVTLLANCRKGAEPEGGIVARINDFKISYKDLADQFKRTRGDVTLEKADDATKRAVLDDMIKEQLTLFEAYRLGYDKDEKITAVAKEKEREIAAKALRKREIDDQLITEEVLRQFYQWSDRELELSYMKFYAGSTPEGRNQAQKKADKIYQRLLAGEDFKSLAVAYSEHGNAKQDSGKMGAINCYSTNRAFFEHAYSLSANEITKPFLADKSVWILKVEKTRPLSRGTFEKERPQILQNVQEIYSGQLNARVNEFNKSVLTEYHYAAFPEVVDFFCLRSKSMKALADTAALFSPEERKKALCKTDVEETTIGPFFHKSAPYYWRSLEQKRTVEMLLSDMNTSRLVKHKAMQMRLNELPQVKEEYQSWLVYYLKKMVTQREVIDKMNTSDQTLWPIYEQKRRTLIVKKQATVREIFCKTKPEIDRVYQLAKAGNDFAALEKKYSQNMEDRTEGIIGPFPPGPNGKLGEAAFSGMRVGEISRPFKYRGGYSIIQLLAREPERVKTFEEAKGELKTDYINSHWEQAVAEWQDRAAKNYRIRVTL